MDCQRSPSLAAELALQLRGAPGVEEAEGDRGGDRAQGRDRQQAGVVGEPAGGLGEEELGEHRRPLAESAQDAHHGERRAGVGGAQVPGQGAGRDEDQVRPRLLEQQLHLLRIVGPGLAEVDRDARRLFAAEVALEGFAGGDHRHRETLGPGLSEVLHQSRGVDPAAGDRQPQRSRLALGRLPGAPRQPGELADPAAFGEPPRQLLQRLGMGDRQAQHGRDSAIADDRVPACGEEVPGGVDVATAAEEQPHLRVRLAPAQVVEQSEAALGHLDVGHLGRDLAAARRHQQDRSGSSRGPQLEAGVAGGVAEEQLDPQAVRRLVELLADLLAGLTRRLRRQHHQAFDSGRVALGRHHPGNDPDQVGAADDEQVVAGMDRPVGLSELRQRSPHHLGDEGEEQADEEDEPGDDLEDADRPLRRPLVVLQGRGVEQMQGGRPEGAAVVGELVEGEVGERGAAEQDDCHGADQERDPAHRRFGNPSPHRRG